MSLRRAAGRGWLRLAHPQTTVRWRLTLLYGGLFLVSGAALLAVTYTLASGSTFSQRPAFITWIGTQTRGAAGAAQVPAGAGSPETFKRTTVSQVTTPQLQQRLDRSVPLPLRKVLGTKFGPQAVQIVGSQQHVADLHELEIESLIALAVMTLISGALGWMVAGRVLRPLRTMTDATQQISEANLHQRLAMAGPPDELRRLADTVDGLLERLEGAFDAQRRFVANASHELRTPLTTTRALLEMEMSDPRATVRTFRATCEQVLEESEHQEQLIDALLALAQGQRGIDRRERFDLAYVALDAVHTRELEASARALRLGFSMTAAPVCGDRRLVERLLTNLLDNALRHNVDAGDIAVGVESHDGCAVLRVVNSGPVIPADEVTRLLQPFQRMTGARVAHGAGLGLGLSIVAAVATAHDAALTVTPGPRGGLSVEVRFPPVRGDAGETEGEPPEPAPLERTARVGAG